MSTLANGPFRGRFEIKIDPKGRMSLPASYRQILASTDSAQPLQLVVTNNRYRGRSCLHVYTLAEWEKLEARIAKLSSLKAEVQAFQRFYLSGGQTVEIDSQNRILVPQGLRKFAELEAPTVLVGMGSKFEIWSQPVWDSIYEDLTENFEETLNAVANLDEGVEP
jgi:MraZ protein